MSRISYSTEGEKRGTRAADLFAKAKNLTDTHLAILIQRDLHGAVRMTLPNLAYTISQVGCANTE